MLQESQNQFAGKSLVGTNKIAMHIMKTITFSQNC